MEINLNPRPVPKCKNCGKEKGRHKAFTYECPFGKGSFPNFYLDQRYEPKKLKVALDTTTIFP